MALFSTSTRAAPANGHLVEFKAGRATLEPGTTPEKRKVVSEKAKGLVFVKQSNDQLVHFCWKNRESNEVVDDLIIFPGDTEFLKVKECKDGRMFMLKFSSNNDRRLFWMQDNNGDKDDELLKKVNDVLNKPPTSRTSGRGGTAERAGGIAASLSSALGNGNDDMGALNNLDQSQLMQLLSLMNSNGTGSSSTDALISSALGGNSTTAADSTVTPTSTTVVAGRRRQSGGTGAVQLSDLQAILNSIDTTESEGDSSAGQSKTPQTDLTEVLKSANISDVVKKNEDRLVPHLPNDGTVQANTEELGKTISTPQFHSATSIFGNALQTGQMAPVLQQFGCGEKVRQAAASGNLLEFAKQLTEEQQGGGPTEEKKETPADVEMTSVEIDAHINREADAEETTESSIKEPEAKRNKTSEDNMDVD